MNEKHLIHLFFCSFYHHFIALYLFANFPIIELPVRINFYMYSRLPSDCLLTTRTAGCAKKLVMLFNYSLVFGTWRFVRIAIDHTLCQSHMPAKTMDKLGVCFTQLFGVLLVGLESVCDRLIASLDFDFY